MAYKSLSLFKGLCPVRIPPTWASDPDAVRWASDNGVQYIDFTANGGPALAFWISSEKSEPGPVEHGQSMVSPGYQEINPAAIKIWGDLQQGGTYVEAYITSQIFGTSAQVIDLVPPDPDDGVRVFPPATLAGIAIDITTPVRYHHAPDSFGGCGFFYAFVRSMDGLVLNANIGMGASGWGRPLLYEETSYEEYLANRPEARENPEKIWNKTWREMQTRNEKFEALQEIFLA